MKYKKLKVCVIDDEPEVRSILCDTLKDSLEFKVVGEAESVEDGIEIIIETKPDAVFLDIKLRGGDAFQLLSNLKRNIDLVPAIILNTGYNDFEFAQKALNLYRDEVIMILQKPFWKDWSKKEDEIIERIREYYQPDEISLTSAKISIKSNQVTWLILLKDLIFIEVPMQYKGRGKLCLETTYKSFIIYSSLHKIEKELPESFVRINRYTIINLLFISHYDHSDQCVYLINIKDRSFGVGDSYKTDLLARLKF
jgi:DNA-binding LytR/AlgR family response regulator